MKKYIQSKENREPIKGVMLAYGPTDYYEENVFIADTNPLVLIRNDHGYPIKETDLVGEEVEYVPTIVDEKGRLVIASLKKAEDITGKTVLDRDIIKVNSAVVTDIFEWGCLVRVNNQYTGKLTNKDYFVDLVGDSEDFFRGGRIASVFSVGDEIPNLECMQGKENKILELYLREKVDISELETYPLNSIDEIQDNMIVECAVRDVFPNKCYLKVAPKIDALCHNPEYLDLDRDLMPEDIVKARLKLKDNRVRGKILEVVKLSDFRYEEMGGDILC